MSVVLIDQPAGIGDILFIQKIVKLIGLNHEVYLPVKESISWIKDYIQDVRFENPEKFDYTLKLDGVSNLLPGERIMESKYLITGIKFHDYINYINITRNLKKESDLFKSKVTAKDYRLICPFYGTPSDSSGSGSFKIQIPESDSLSNVVLDYNPDYTIFDWISIITEAKEIYTTDSCIMFLIEKYKCRASKLVAYSRRPDAKEIDYMFSKNWEYRC